MSDYPPPPGSPTPPGSGDSSATPPPPPPAGGDPSAAPPPTGAGYGSAPPPTPAGYGTPPAAGVRPGELLDRFVARLIDLILVGVVAGIINTVLLVAVLGLNGSGFGMGGSFAYGAISAVITAVIYLGYFGYMESSQGKTLGKMIMKLRVVAPSGGNPSFEEACKRNIWLGLPILGIIPILGGLVAFAGEIAAIIMCAVGINSDPQRQHWFDKFAGGTQVLKEG